MPAFTDGIRIGDEVGLKASFVDPDGAPATVREGTEAWQVLGATGVIVLATSTAGALHQIAIGQNPGTRTVEFTSLDEFGDPVSAFQPITVIDANGLRFGFSLANDVAIES